MSPNPASVRRAGLRGLAAAALAMASFAAMPALSADAASTPPAISTFALTHGGVPLLGAPAPTGVSTAVKAASTTPAMTYGGGTSAGGETVGVEAATPRVYLVFWGSQWGAESTTGTYPTFAGDTMHMAPDLEAFFTGLGTDGETWSNVMTQYCQGIAKGANPKTCTSSDTYVGAPSNGVLAGVWEDTSAAAPGTATDTQIAQEAVKAASYFGNTTAASNLGNQYVIVSPTGTHPGGFNTPSGGFCAWHDYTGDGYGITGASAAIAFTNLPYITDMGTSCGENYVNAGTAGVLDGVTIVEGHEYAETLTDMFPAGGYTNSTGYEVGDTCAWNAGVGAKAANLTLSTGTFAVQSIWGNDSTAGSTGGCELSDAAHPNTLGAASKLVVAVAPQLGASGSPLTTQPVVYVTDANGTVETGNSDVITATISGGTFAGSATTATETASGGVATFSGLSVTASGPVTITYSDGSLTPAASTNIAVPGQSPTTLALTTAPSASAQNGVALATQPVVQVENGSGTALSDAGVTVTATLATGTGTLTNATAVTNASGAASFSGLTIAGTAGNVTLSFGASGLTSVTSGTIALAAGAASKLVLTTSPGTTATNGTVFAKQPVLKVEDAGGNVVTSATGTVTAAVTTGAAALSATTNPVTLASGVATFAGMKLTGTTGSDTITFSDGFFTTTVTLTLSAGAASKLVITTPPVGGAHTSTLTAIKVTVEDASGNVVTSSATVKAALGTKPTGATLSGTTSVSTSAGVATFSSLKVSAAGSYTLTFTDGALSVTSASFTMS